MRKVRVNPSVKIGYFAQELDNLNPAASVLDEVLTGKLSLKARLLLACLLFRRDAVYKRIGDLSMGKKGRVAFAKLILSGPISSSSMSRPTIWISNPGGH